ncbi:MAG TPA: VOC family protein [Clostridia bacterium]|nr:VOC family protein [Clostridia bacterium]
MKTPIPLDGFIQIAICVPDVEKALDAWCDLLGIQERPGIRETSCEPKPALDYRGTTPCYAQKMAVIPCRERGFVLELMEVDENPSTFREFMNEHGVGVHHIGFQVGDKRDEVVAELKEKGYALRTEQQQGTWTIVDTEARLGVNLNVKYKM